MKLVSVLIPTYHRPETLSRAIDSALNQDYPEIEVVVADDNGVGTEFGLKTEEVMKAYSDNPRVKYVQHQNNVNGSAARNSAFRASSGEYVALLDDDDEFLPIKISSQVKRLEELDESWGVCYCDYEKVSQDGSRVLAKSGENAEGDLLIEELKRNFMISAGSNLMVKRSVFEEVGGFDESFLRNQDVEFLVKILKKYKIAHAKALGLRVYSHANRLRNSTFEDITSRFVETFRNDIETLGDDKSQVYKMIDLQLFRNVIVRNRDFKGALRMIKSRQVSVFVAIKYFIHLAYRKLFRVSKGFKHRF